VQINREKKEGGSTNPVACVPVQRTGKRLLITGGRGVGCTRKKRKNPLGWGGVFALSSRERGEVAFRLFRSWVDSPQAGRRNFSSFKLP